MLKWKSPAESSGEGGILEICRLCLEKHNNLYRAKNLESFLYFVVPDLDLSLSENPLICFQCIQQLTDSYIFKTRCIYNQDQILKLQHLFQRPVYLQEVVQGIDFHKENEQTSEVVYNSLKILLGKEFGNSKSINISESVANKEEEEETVGEDVIEYCCEEEVVEIKKEYCYSELTNVQLSENDEFVENQISMGPLESAEVEINYVEEHAEELSSIDCKRFPTLPLPSLVSQKPKTTSGKPFQCHFCYKLFTQKIHCDGHLLNKHKDVPNIETYISNKIHCCQYCNYRTINSYNLSSHIFTKHDNKYGGIKLVKCDICEYSTHNKGNLLIHMRRHDNVKPFNCKLCNRRFAEKVKLDRHYLTLHSNEESIDLLISSKIYACNTCSFKSVDKRGYAEHVNTQHLQNLL